MTCRPRSRLRRLILHTLVCLINLRYVDNHPHCPDLCRHKSPSLTFSGHVIYGNVVNSTTDTIYGSRHTALGVGAKIETPAYNVNRLCGSGIQAIIDAKNMIKFISILLLSSLFSLLSFILILSLFPLFPLLYCSTSLISQPRRS